MPDSNPSRTAKLNLGIGIFVVLTLTAVKVCLVKDSHWGRWLDARGYELLHSIISPFNPEKDLSVSVLDISDVPRLPNGATPISSLQEIVEALVDARAKAIAIDIDFSPGVEPINTATFEDQSEDLNRFYDKIQELRARNIPIFLGTFNVGPEPKTWLGLEETKNFAADITLFDQDTTLIPRWLSCDGGATLNSISLALSNTAGRQPMPNAPLKSLLEDPEEERNLRTTLLRNQAGADIICKRSFTFTNYSKLSLLQKLTLQWAGREALLSARDENGNGRFVGKLVLVGNTQRGKFTDPFVVAGRPEPVAGVYLHAAATYSLVDEPIYKFNHRVEIFVDLILGAGLVLALFLIRRMHLRKKSAKPKPYLSEGVLILGLTVFLLLAACLLVKFFDVLWLDVSLVIIALFLHSKVQEGLLWIINRILGREDTAKG